MTEGILIGPQVKAARKLRDIPTRKVLAGRIDRSGFGEKVIGQVERNERPVRDHELQWLAAALDMTPEELTREPNAEPSVASELSEIKQAIADLHAERAREAREIDAQLTRQTNTLAEMRGTLADIRKEQETLRGLIADEKQAKRAAEAAAQEMRDLLDTLAAATQAFPGGLPSMAAEPGHTAR